MVNKICQHFSEKYHNDLTLFVACSVKTSNTNFTEFFKQCQQLVLTNSCADWLWCVYQSGIPCWSISSYLPAHHAAVSTHSTWYEAHDVHTPTDHADLSNVNIFHKNTSMLYFHVTPWLLQIISHDIAAYIK